MYSKLVILGLFLGNVFAIQTVKEIRIALRQDNINDLKEALENVSNPYSSSYGDYWTKEKISDLISPSDEEKVSLNEWIGGYNVSCYDMGDVYSCIGDEDVVNSMFKVVPNRFTYVIPEQFTDLIIFVEGLFKNHIGNKPKIGITVNSNADSGYVGREVLQRVYGLPNTTVVNVSTAAIEYQNTCGFSGIDLSISQIENNEHLKLVKNIVGPNYSPDSESELDVQMISQVVDGVDLWYWQGKNWLYSLAVDFFNASEIPEVISMSWGWAEDNQCDIIICSENMTSQLYVSRVNVEYMKIGLRGTTIVVASGDAGAPGRTSEMCDPRRPVNPVFPGSSPYVSSVGATYLIKNNFTPPTWHTHLCKETICASGIEEAVVNYNTIGWTSGGGFGVYSEGTPSWQKEVVLKYLSSNVSFPSIFNKQGRAYPDVAVVGHNCATFEGRVLNSVDGTSCSSPTFAGILTLLNYHQKQMGKPRLGFANPVLYEMSRLTPSSFNDIIVGNNQCTEYMCCYPNLSDFGYEATVGFDAVSGLGTPNYEGMIEWLDKYT